MRTNPATRQRYPIQNVVTPGLAQIQAGVWGSPAPVQNEFIQELSTPTGQSFYRYHEGDFFLPGGPLWCLDPSHDTPLYTVWGQGFLVRANAFRPIAYGQIAYTAPVQPLVGVGGPISGQWMTQPLTVREGGTE